MAVTAWSAKPSCTVPSAGAGLQPPSEHGAAPYSNATAGLVPPDGSTWATSSAPVLVTDFAAIELIDGGIAPCSPNTTIWSASASATSTWPVDPSTASPRPRVRCPAPNLPIGEPPAV